MKQEKKKIAAAVSAVNQYLEQERAQELEERAPTPFPSLWAYSGRQEIMAGRALLTSGFFKH
ncbi:MAG: hypothetical protein R6V10_15350 [bacterium]